MNKNKRKIPIMLGICIIIQTIIFIIAGYYKSYLHIDEAYSYGLASYNKTEIQDNKDFYNTWHNKEYYEDYLTVNENEKYNFKQVYENQKNDNHPPLYYLLLRIAMGFSMNKYSKWTGIVINIIIYMFITIFMYLIISKLLNEQKKYKEKAVILAFVSSITLSSLTNVIFIRMYATSTLNIVITTYLHLKLLEQENNKLLIGICITTLIGSLTHYYYLFYLLALFVMFVIRYIKKKQYKQLSKYILTMLIAALFSLTIFPYSIKHIFFGYRGKGVFNNLTNMFKYFINIILYTIITNVYVFNNLLFILLIVIGIICVYKLIKHKKIVETKNKYAKYIAIPTVFYFIIVSICSPYIELRYILPISPMLFIMIFYYMLTILGNIVSKKTINKIMITINLSMLITIFLSNKIIDLAIGETFRNRQETSYSSKAELVEDLKKYSNLPINMIPKLDGIPIENVLFFIKNLKIEPQVMYSNMNEVIERIDKELNNVPALYIFNSSNNRFLDDILLFAKIKESYIAKDIECNEENIKKIMKDKDISNGVLIFINDWQDNEKIINIIKKNTGLQSITYLKRLNMCDVYYIK